MGAGVAGDSEEEVSKLHKLGLIARHAYGLIACAEVADRYGKLT